MSVEHAKRAGENLGVLYIDIDGFKEVNDTYGHAEGDAILKSVSELIVDQTRDSDVVARIYGDEIAQNVEAAISVKPYEINGEPISIGAGVGASVYPSDTSDINKLVKMADMRMCGNKKARKKCAADQDPYVRFYKPLDVKDLTS